MVTQNMLRTHEENRSFQREKDPFRDCLTFALIFESPVNTSTSHAEGNNCESKNVPIPEICLFFVGDSRFGIITSYLNLTEY